MKANELRIGNYVYYPMRDEHFAIDRGLFEYNEGLANLEDFRPIPLTEEWLKDFGFTNYYSGWTGWYSNENSQIIVREFQPFAALLPSTHEAFEHEVLVHELKYVHQLQNLYFCLTRKELTK